MKAREPLISIVTINFNGKKWLKDYVNTLKKQTYGNFEVIFVDNGSNDGSVEYIEKNYPGAIIIKNKKNYAISKGNNIGVRRAKGDYILLLNNDIKAGKTYLSDFVEGFTKIPQASILQSKIVFMNDPEYLDSCGSFWADTGFIYHYGNQKKADLPQYNKPIRFFSVKSASMLIKKEVIDKIGMYDDLYWGYYEETDHCHRAWIAGFETWYWPKAVIEHARGGTTLSFENSFLQFHNFKNKISSFLVNFQVWYQIYLLPLFLILNIFISIGWLLNGKGSNALSLYRAIGWNISHVKHTLKRRRLVQSSRVLTDSQIFKLCRKNPRPSFYISLFTGDLSGYRDDPVVTLV